MSLKIPTGLVKPRGKPSAYIRTLISENTNHGQELIEWGLAMLRGKIIQRQVLPGGLVIAVEPSNKDRIEAWKMLLAYFAGKPQEKMELTGDVENPVTIVSENQARDLSDGELRDIIGILARATGREFDAGHVAKGLGAAASTAIVEVVPTPTAPPTATIPGSTPES